MTVSADGFPIVQKTELSLKQITVAQTCFTESFPYAHATLTGFPYGLCSSACDVEPSPDRRLQFCQPVDSGGV